VPQVYWVSGEDVYNIMAFELLGPSLEDLLSYCGKTLSLKTVLMLADQLILRLRHIHSKGYVHRDIKPDNMLMGDGKQGSTVYVTDMGKAKQLTPGELEQSAPSVGRARVTGTLWYASINDHLGKGIPMSVIKISVLILSV
jgi:serine/threonine protein kinase